VGYTERPQTAEKAFLQTHLRDRFTGAALLVLFVVLLVPEMFRGRPTRPPQPASAVPEGPPVRSYNIDLRDNDSAQPLPPGAPLSAGIPLSAAPPGTTESTPAASSPANAPAPATATAPASPTAAANASAPANAAAPAPEPARAAVAARAPVPARAGARAGWVVQVGSYSRRDFADRMVRQMKAKGFAVQVAGPDDRGLYRVRSTPYPERASAMALRQQMQQKGLKPIVNTLP